MNKRFPLVSFTVALAMLSALPACSKEDPAPASAAPVAPLRSPADPVALAQTAEAQRISRLAQPEPSVPVEQYVTLESGNQLMFAYYALSGLPIDHATAAQRMSREFRDTSDSFRKRDLLEALKPRIDASVAQAHNTPYMRLDIRGASLLSTYDFERKGFMVKALSDASSSRYFNDNSTYQIKFPNSESFALLPVEDEAQARKLEDMVSKYQSMELRVYAFANDTDTAQNVVKALITRIVVTDQRGQKLAEFAPKQ